MIIGIIALISALLFGGNTESYFLVEDIDKAAKEVVTDKIRQQLIISTIKQEKSNAKKHYKISDANKKKIKKQLTDIDTKGEDIIVVFEQQISNLETHQKLVFDTRLKALENITPQEWDAIVRYSKARFDKNRNKEVKKQAKKSKVILAPVEKTINNTLANDDAKSEILAQLTLLNTQLDAIASKINKRNVKDNIIIQNYDSNFDELNKIATEMNDERLKTLSSILHFRLQLKNKTNPQEWTTIMKSVDKALFN